VCVWGGACLWLRAWCVSWSVCRQRVCVLACCVWVCCSQTDHASKLHTPT
jgi:hypothetical protein